jgi:predicted transcriptional regulator
MTIFNPDRIGVMEPWDAPYQNKLGLNADIEFGISRTAVIAASMGLNIFVLVSGQIEQPHDPGN